MEEPAPLPPPPPCRKKRLRPRSVASFSSPVDATSAASSVSPEALEASLEWEEWSGDGIFWHHMLAGSAAGVAEHLCMYPIDTFKVRAARRADFPARAGN
jgi:Mitochondrial carrier protein